MIEITTEFMADPATWKQIPELSQELPVVVTNEQGDAIAVLICLKQAPSTHRASRIARIIQNAILLARETGTLD